MQQCKINETLDCDAVATYVGYLNPATKFSCSEFDCFYVQTDYFDISANMNIKLNFVCKYIA